MFFDQIVYVGEGIRIMSVFCPPIAHTLATVLALYSKEAGAGSNHAWQSSTNSIGAISYLVVRVYEAPGCTNQFRSLLNSQTVTRADQAFLHIPATQFLCRLQDLQSLQRPGSSSSLIKIGWFSRRLPVPWHFVRNWRKQSRNLTQPLGGRSEL